MATRNSDLVKHNTGYKEPEYVISKNRADKVYRAVNDKILDARIALKKMVDARTFINIDNIMFKLNQEVPQSALDILKKPIKNKKQ